MGKMLAQLKKELKENQDALAESQKKVSTLEIKLSSQASVEKINDQEDLNQNIVCQSCDYVARNQGDLESHVKIVHKKTQNRCTACNKVFRNSNDLEKHIQNEHNDDVDCVKCKAVFRTEADALSHANNCNEVIPLNFCQHCKKDIVRRAALKKHTKSCHAKQNNKALCRNGDSCHYLRNKRCSYDHPQQQDRHPINQHSQDWHTVQPRQRRFRCHNCKTDFNNQDAKQNHICNRHQVHTTDGPQSTKNRKDIDCRWGSECFRWAKGTC